MLFYFHRIQSTQSLFLNIFIYTEIHTRYTQKINKNAKDIKQKRIIITHLFLRVCTIYG